MNRRGTPEADLQRAVVQALRTVLPRTAIIHHCANEVTEPGPRGAKRQAILVGMGVHAGFADLMVICDGRVLFLELKAPKADCAPRRRRFAMRCWRRGLAGRWCAASTMRWAR
jgi:hypothetical protein